MLGVSRRLAAAAASAGCRPRLPRGRPPGALSRPVQLSLLARLVRRPLSAAPEERDLPRPDRRRQRARRRRGPDRAPRSARGRRLQPRRPPGGPPGKRPADRAGPPGPGGAHLRAGRPANARPTCWRRSTAGPRPTTRTSVERPRSRDGQAAGTSTARAVRRADHPQAAGLDQLLVYDRHPRKALVDHFYPVDVTLDDLIACREVERGDFVRRDLPGESPARARIASRSSWSGRAVPTGIRSGSARRSSLPPASPGLAVHYELEDLPRRTSVSISPSRSTWRPWPATPPTATTPTRPAPSSGCSTPGSTCPTPRGLTLTDQWLDLSVGLTWSQAAGLWCFPIETVSQSEGGFEGVYQSSAVIPHWHVTADEHGRWEVWIRWTFDHAAGPASAHRASELMAEVEIA